MSKANLLYLIGDLGYGGAERHLTCTLKRLNRGKYNPFVVCFNKTGAYLPEIEKLNIPVMDLKLKKIHSLNGIRKLFFLLSFIQENRIDLIQSYLYSADFFGAIAAWIAGIPAITSARSMTSMFSGRRWLLQRIAAQLSTVTVAVSEEVRRSYIHRGVSPGKILTVYNGVESPGVGASGDGLAYRRRKLGLNLDGPVIGTIANLNPQKGHRYLLHAAAKVVTVIPWAQFLLAGDGLLRAELEELADRLNLKGGIIFAGHRNDIPELLALMDVFVLPSLTEGMSNALLEAMVAGLPCIATGVGGNAELIEDGVTGLLTPSENAEGLAKAMLRVLQDDDLACKMGENARQMVLSKYSIAETVSQMERLYDSLLR